MPLGHTWDALTVEGDRIAQTLGLQNARADQGFDVFAKYALKNRTYYDVVRVRIGPTLAGFK